MNIYLDLLEENGISFTNEEKDEFLLSAGKAEDSESQTTPTVNEESGIHDTCFEYDWQPESPQYEYSWKDIHHTNLRKPHLYDRKYRFKWCFYHLISAMGKTPPDNIMEDLKTKFDKKVQGRRAYQVIYKYLKQNKLSIYYMSIPYIIQRLGGTRFNISSEKTRDIINQFNKFHYIFEKFKNKYSRIRFPKMLYISLRLLNEHGIEPPYRIPLTRTAKRRIKLEPLYNDLNNSTKDV